MTPPPHRRPRGAPRPASQFVRQAKIPDFPLDSDSDGAGGDEIPELAPGAGKYYAGRIVKLNPNNERGIIRSSTGRVIPFVFPYVTMIGPRRRFEDLREHMQVVFDVSQTSRGLRVSLIRIPD